MITNTEEGTPRLTILSRVGGVRDLQTGLGLNLLTPYTHHSELQFSTAL
jgi:hypothetical protein